MIYFISPSTKGGAKDTASQISADKYRSIQNEKSTWIQIPKKMSPVTGKLSKDGTTKAFIFDEFEWNLDSKSKVDLTKMA